MIPGQIQGNPNPLASVPNLPVGAVVFSSTTVSAPGYLNVSRGQELSSVSFNSSIATVPTVSKFLYTNSSYSSTIGGFMFSATNNLLIATAIDRPSFAACNSTHTGVIVTCTTGGTLNKIMFLDANLKWAWAFNGGGTGVIPANIGFFSATNRWFVLDTSIAMTARVFDGTGSPTASAWTQLTFTGSTPTLDTFISCGSVIINYAGNTGGTASHVSSNNGASWTAVTLPAAAYIFTNGTYFYLSLSAGMNNGSILYRSSDGLTWTNIGTMSIATIPTNLTDIWYYNGKFYGYYGLGVTLYIRDSTDGLTWSASRSISTLGGTSALILENTPYITYANNAGNTSYFTDFTQSTLSQVLTYPAVCYFSLGSTFRKRFALAMPNECWFIGKGSAFVALVQAYKSGYIVGTYTGRFTGTSNTSGSDRSAARDANSLLVKTYTEGTSTTAFVWVPKGFGAIGRSASFVGSVYNQAYYACLENSKWYAWNFPPNTGTDSNLNIVVNLSGAGGTNYVFGTLSGSETLQSLHAGFSSVASHSIVSWISYWNPTTRRSLSVTIDDWVSYTSWTDCVLLGVVGNYYVVTDGTMFYLQASSITTIPTSSFGTVQGNLFSACACPETNQVFVYTPGYCYVVDKSGFVKTIIDSEHITTTVIRAGQTGPYPNIGSYLNILADIPAEAAAAAHIYTPSATTNAVTVNQTVKSQAGGYCRANPQIHNSNYNSGFLTLFAYSWNTDSPSPSFSGNSIAVPVAAPSSSLNSYQRVF